MRLRSTFAVNLIGVVSLVFVASLAIYMPSAFAQEIKNPSLTIEDVKIPWHEFNKVARNAETVQLNNVHEISWQVTVTNDLMYANPDGNAVLRVYDKDDPEIFIEIGMGSPPDDRFWVGAQMPEEGYVIVNKRLERGWIPSSKIIASYTNQAGLTVNNGERIVVSNLDIGEFAMGSYSVHGMESTTDPPATNSGKLRVEFMSGDPSQNLFHLFPFYVTAAVGALAGALYITKKRR